MGRSVAEAINALFNRIDRAESSVCFAASARRADLVSGFSCALFPFNFPARLPEPLAAA
jgi:hypothetical protein